jgi:DNA-binding IclR family transcriptional regulator
MNGMPVPPHGTQAKDGRPGRDGSATAKPSGTAADKVLYVLAVFEERSRWELQDLAKRLNMPKSTVHRLLGTLRKMQFVDQDPRDSSYHLGFRLWSLAQRSRDFDALAAAATPTLEDLVGETHETAFLMVREGIHALCIARVDTPQGVRFLIEVGSASPLHLGASNSVILAFLDGPERSSLLARMVLPPDVRERTEQEMRTIARQGFAYTSEQLTPGAAAIGVPVLDARGGVVAGLSIGAPAYRFDRERALTMLPSLQRAARSLAQRLGRGSQTAHQQAR